eukprot:g30672.t1
MAARYGGRRNNGPKPETALRKAQDFLRVGKSEDALKHLHAILVARRYKVWTETYEEIMFLYVELAVKLQENVKEGLMQYQKITNPEHYASLKKVINRYMELAELRTLQAVAEAEAKKEETISEDADGVDLDDSPESLMLQAVTGEDSDARTDKKILAPKVKYLYETYRAVLDVLRNISLLQDYYQLMCRHAFRFCERYRRTSEFRKFMDQMRKHMLDIEKHGNLTYAINLKSSETQRLYLQTRVVQLKVAASLELWTMAYHTIEDIHDNTELSETIPSDIPDNTELSETIPSASLKKIFYEKLARIFQASDNNMFHAYCLGEYYSLVRKDGQLTPEQDTALADAVVLAALSIPPTKGEQVKFMVDNESNRRLATYLGFDTTPTRAHLLSELQAEGVLENASPEVRELHTLFETSFGPLSLTKKVEAILQRFEQKAELEPDQSPACSDGNEDNVLNDADDNKVAVFDLHTYLTSLRRLTVLRLIEQLSQVYSSLRLAKLYQLSPDMGSHWELERIMLVAAKQGYVRLRLDHRTQMVWFQPPSSGMDWDSANINKSLSGLFDKLSTILQKVAPVDAAAKQEERKRVFEAIWEGVEGEHRQVARRIAEIEKRKQNMERQQQEKERRDAEQRANEKAKRLAEEQERLKAEAEKRVREKEAAEKKLKDMEEKKKQLQKLQEAQQSVGVRAAAKKVEELKDKIAEVDAQDLVKAREELEAEAERRKEKRRTDQQRAVDFLERAIRLEELPKRKEYMKVELKQMRQRVDLEVKREQDEAQLLAEKREQARARLAKYRGFKEKFVEKVMAVRKAKYEKELEMRREREEERRLQEEEEEEERRREEERRDEERAKEEEERAIREKEEEEKEKEKEKERAEKEALEEAAREERVRQREKERQERLAKLKREELGSRETEEDKRAAMRGGREGEDREPGPERERERPPVRGGRFARDPDEAPSARSGGGRFARDEDSSGPPRGVRFGRDDDERRPPIRGDDRDREPRDRDGPFRSGGGPPDRAGEEELHAAAAATGKEETDLALAASTAGMNDQDDSIVNAMIGQQAASTEGQKNARVAASTGNVKEGHNATAIVTARAVQGGASGIAVEIGIASVVIGTMDLLAAAEAGSVARAAAGASGAEAVTRTPATGDAAAAEEEAQATATGKSAATGSAAEVAEVVAAETTRARGGAAGAVAHARSEMANATTGLLSASAGTGRGHAVTGRPDDSAGTRMMRGARGGAVDKAGAAAISRRPRRPVLAATAAVPVRPEEAVGAGAKGAAGAGMAADALVPRAGRQRTRTITTTHNLKAERTMTGSRSWAGRLGATGGRQDLWIFFLCYINTQPNDTPLATTNPLTRKQFYFLVTKSTNRDYVSASAPLSALLELSVPEEIKWASLI